MQRHNDPILDLGVRDRIFVICRYTAFIICGLGIRVSIFVPGQVEQSVFAGNQVVFLQRKNKVLKLSVENSKK